jgi:hypothetical protein
VDGERRTREWPVLVGSAKNARHGRLVVDSVYANAENIVFA